MITHINVNLLEFKLDAFIHQANCFHTFGAGIARQIKNKYPELYEADLKHGPPGEISRLGDFSWCQCHDDKIGYNLYGQFGMGGIRSTNYEAVYTGLSKIKEHALNNNVHSMGLPYNMGCSLGGGSWSIVSAIIGEIFYNSDLELYICNYTPPTNH